VPSRVRVPLHPLAAGDVLLGEAEARYVARVHRLGVGTTIVVFDPEAGTEADAAVTAIGEHGRKVRCLVTRVRSATKVPSRSVTLLQCLGKGDKPERVVREATTLSVARIVFAESARSVVVVGDRGPAKQRRWCAAAVDAARQSGRGDLPQIDGPMTFTDALAAASDADVRLCLAPDGGTTLGHVLRLSPPDASLALIVGPEGGLDAGELDAAREAAFSSVSFGGLVLRTETCAVAALGAILAFGSEK
jgi:16S rRNA (uracil1498-N3)-methyltransferase